MADHLQAADKRKIEGAYLSGSKPVEIARKLGKKPATIRQFLYRQGLTSRRDEIAVAKKRTAREVLEIARQQHVEELATVLGLAGESLKIDAERLRDGWPMVDGAADASALMRGKSLLFDRILRFYALENSPAEQNSAVNVMFIGALPRSAAKQVCELPPA